MAGSHSNVYLYTTNPVLKRQVEEYRGFIMINKVRTYTNIPFFKQDGKYSMTASFSSYNQGRSHGFETGGTNLSNHNELC